MKIDIVHAQHRLTGPPSIAAANREGIPSVCTIRDYWPVCYWSDLIVTPDSEALCPSCTVSTMPRCVRPRAGALWPLAIPMIPYMRSNLARKRTALSRATAVIAVSSAIATDLKVRAPELGETEVQTIPNPVDVEGLRSTAALLPTPLDGSYGLFVGKLEINKGVSKLLKALERAQFDLPFVVIGDGSERDRLERAAKGTGRDIRFRRVFLGCRLPQWTPEGRVTSFFMSRQDFYHRPLTNSVWILGDYVMTEICGNDLVVLHRNMWMQHFQVAW